MKVVEAIVFVVALVFFAAVALTIAAVLVAALVDGIRSLFSRNQ